MSSTSGFPEEVPMSVRMQRALDDVRRMSVPEKIQLLFRAGLMTEAEAREATDRVTREKTTRRKPKHPRLTPAPKSAKPRTS